MLYLNLTVSVLLTAFAGSVVWLFVTDRLWEPNEVYWWIEVIMASSCGIVGLVSAELNIRNRKKRR
jgi:hypothetical protein